MKFSKGIVMSTTFYKKCPGCGLEKPFTSHDQLYCKQCYRALHYGEISNDLNPFKLEEFATDLSALNQNVFLVSDVLNFTQSIPVNLNQIVKGKNLYFVINKVDIIPKSLSAQILINRLETKLNELKIEYKGLFLTSALKQKGIDDLFKFIIASKKNAAFIGNSNSGKSSLVKALLKCTNKESHTIISNTIGTTLDKLVIPLNDQVALIDYPGFYLNGNVQNYLEKANLKRLLPNKEIRALNFQINKPVGFLIEDFFYFEVEPIDKSNEQQSIQIWMSNQVKIERRNPNNPPFSEKSATNDIIKRKFKDEFFSKEQRRMLTISGLGIIFISAKIKINGIYSRSEFKIILEPSYLLH